MFDLFKNELNRFGKLAIIFCVVLIGGWVYHSISTPLVEMGTSKVMSVHMFTVFSSLIFGIVQMYLHRRKAQWTYLMHRPIAPSKIHLSLTSAGALMLFVAIVLPLLVVTIGYDLATNMVIEGRHYLWPLHLVFLSLIGYFIGTYAVLSPHKAAILSFGWIILIIGSRDIVSNETLLGLDFLTLIIVFLLSRISFKVDLSAQFSDKKSVLFSALVLQPGFAFLLVFSQIAYYHFPLLLVDKHPDQYDAAQHAGYFSEVWRVKGAEAIEKFVDDSHPQKQQLVQQMENAQTYRLNTRFSPKPFVGQSHQYDKQYALNDNNNRTQWVFSHRLGVLVGHHQVTDQPTGYIGVKGFLDSKATITQQDRFKGVPSVLFDKFIQTENTIYVVDFEQQELEVKHLLVADEYYESVVTPQNSGDYYIVASNKSLYAFSFSDFEEANQRSEPSYVIKHPFPYDSSISIRYTDLIDGYLFDYQSSGLFGYKKPGYGLLYVKHDGTSELITTHTFKGYRPIPLWISAQDYWISPIVGGVVYSYLDSLTRPSSPEDYMPLNETFSVYPAHIYYIMLFAALFSAAVTWMLARKIKLSTSNTLMWCGLNLLCALPGLLAFFFMTNWRESLYAAKHSSQKQ